MLTHPTHDRLIALGLTGMAKALEEQRRQPDIAALAFEERIAMMIDREAIERENKRLTTRLKFACLRQSAIVEDVDIALHHFGSEDIGSVRICEGLGVKLPGPTRHGTKPLAR